ncbi:cytochrome c oxidase subunit I [Gimesia maris]|uniref:cytochrome c oxidase subunit I n=1 Tax=Gimesia maris TaxID=122 RepID=UPI00241EBEAC|nr:cbb3-type cytochrome c oxidase subunit I [Gimesia maris]|tara:strand:- start:387 stop:2105 length:1719 start_codon:yes stop_codon:yes gene_type:complete
MATVVDSSNPKSDFPIQYRELNYLNCSKGWKSWFFTLDHKRIGIMYLIGVTVAFFLGGIFAVLLRTELLSPEKMFLSADGYNQMFTLHGAIMTFLVIIPGVPAAIGNIILPVMLGAKDVAFPRMNLGSFYLWMFGAAFFLAALALGGLDTGWTFYTPYSITTSTAVRTALLGVFILGFSSIFTGLNFIVTIHTMRPPGMTWFKMPLFLWALYATALIQILATPVLGITGLLLIVEKTFEIGIFDPRLGGDPVLFQHFFWFYSHPAVYVMILPAMGVVSEVIAVHSRKHIFGYRFIAYSSIAIAVFGFLVWGHHMFVSGQSKVVAVVFSAITFSVSIPSAIKVFNWLTTMYKGSIRFTTAMCYALAFLFIFSIGGLTGLFLATLATDIHLHDTYFVVAHFHYVMMGSSLVGLFAAVHHWWPKITGKMFNEFWGRIACLGVFLGFNLTFFPQFLLGTRGMPRRYYTYLPEFQNLHILSTCGAYLLGLSSALMAATLIYSVYRGKHAPANPWGGASLEWQCSSPPPHNNFDHPPLAGDPYIMKSVVYNEEIGGYVPVECQGADKDSVTASGDKEV